MHPAAEEGAQGADEEGVEGDPDEGVDNAEHLALGGLGGLVAVTCKSAVTQLSGTDDSWRSERNI